MTRLAALGRTGTVSRSLRGDVSSLVAHCICDSYNECMWRIATAGGLALAGQPVFLSALKDGVPRQEDCDGKILPTNVGTKTIPTTYHTNSTQSTHSTSEGHSTRRGHSLYSAIVGPSEFCPVISAAWGRYNCLYPAMCCDTHLPNQDCRGR